MRAISSAPGGSAVTSTGFQSAPRRSSSRPWIETRPSPSGSDLRGMYEGVSLSLLLLLLLLQPVPDQDQDQEREQEKSKAPPGPTKNARIVGEQSSRDSPNKPGKLNSAVSSARNKSSPPPA